MHMFIVIASLGYLYRGLIRFGSGESRIVGFVYALQEWFVKHTSSQASHFNDIDKWLAIEQYCKKLDLEEEQIIYDYFDRKATWTYHTCNFN